MAKKKKKEVCPFCNGTGRIEKGMGSLEKKNTCVLCNGKGYIMEGK